MADHALTQDGTGVFNVSIEATATTWSRPLRVRWRPGSFEYDYDRHLIIQSHSTGSALFWIADYITTETELGKDEARLFMRSRGWNKYVPPPPMIVTLPTPTPIVSPTASPVATVAPTELADPLLPISERIEKQREIFLDQQQALVARISFALKMHEITQQDGKEYRKKLIERQLRVLERYFPKDNEQVKLTIEALEDQLQKIEENGRFSWEF
jgi:hypothetical protein